MGDTLAQNAMSKDREGALRGMSAFGSDQDSEEPVNAWYCSKLSWLVSSISTRFTA